MQFYKKRDFGNLISDTFDFFRQYGANYFKNYIAINGSMLLLLLVVIVFGYGELIQQIFSSNLTGKQFFFEQYFAENLGVLVGVSVIVVILSILFYIVSYSFPVFYMKRISESPGNKVGVEQSLDDLKSNIRKIMTFFIGMIGVGFVLMLLLGFSIGLVSLISKYLSALFIIAFVLFIPALINIFNLTMFEYYHTENGFFDSLNFAFRTQISDNFFKYWGTTIILLLIIQIIGYVFSFVSISIGVSNELINPSGDEIGTTTIVIMFIVYLLSVVVNLLLTNTLYIGSGLMYYDGKKEFHKDIQLSEIDSIGRGE